MGSVSVMIQELRDQSNQDAASDLYQRYFERLVAVLRSRINRRVQGMDGPESTSQYVLAEVLMGLKEGAYPQLNDREGLWALMIHIGGQRVKQEWRYATAAKRDVRITGPMDLAGAEQSSSRVIDPITTTPPPELAIEVEDMVAHLTARLSDRKLHDILVWELQGLNSEDIQAALRAKLGCEVSARSVRRWRALMREELRAIYPEELMTFDSDG